MERQGYEVDADAPVRSRDLFSGGVQTRAAAARGVIDAGRAEGKAHALREFGVSDRGLAERVRRRWIAEDADAQQVAALPLVRGKFVRQPTREGHEPASTSAPIDEVRRVAIARRGAHLSSTGGKPADANLIGEVDSGGSTAQPTGASSDEHTTEHTTEHIADSTAENVNKSASTNAEANVDGRRGASVNAADAAISLTPTDPRPPAGAASPAPSAGALALPAVTVARLAADIEGREQFSAPNVTLPVVRVQRLSTHSTNLARAQDASTSPKAPAASMPPDSTWAGQHSTGVGVELPGAARPGGSAPASDSRMARTATSGVGGIPASSAASLAGGLAGGSKGDSLEGLAANSNAAFVAKATAHNQEQLVAHSVAHVGPAPTASSSAEHIATRAMRWGTPIVQRRPGAASDLLLNDAGPEPTLPSQAALPSSAAAPPSEEITALPETESQPTGSSAALPVAPAHHSLSPVPNLVLDGAAARDERSARGQAAQEAAESMAARGAAPLGPANLAAARNELPLQAQTKPGEPTPTATPSATPSATPTDPVGVPTASAIGAALPGAQRTADAPLEIVQRTFHTLTILAASSGTASGLAAATTPGTADETADETATERAAESAANDEVRRDTAHVQVQSTLRPGGSTAAGLAAVDPGNPSVLPADAFPAAPTIRPQRAVAITERTTRAGQQAGRENMAALPAHAGGSRGDESSTPTATADANQPGTGGFPGIGLMQRQTQPAGPAAAVLHVSLPQRARVRTEDEPYRLPVVPITPVAHYTGNSAATSATNSAGRSDHLQTDMQLSREPVRRAAAEMGERMAFSNLERGAGTLQAYSIPTMAVAAGTGLSEFPAFYLQRQASASTSSTGGPSTGGSNAAESGEAPATSATHTPDAQKAQQATLESLDMERVATAVYGIIRERLIAERENRGL